jgi:UDP-sugar pyrophosphorylase
MNASLALEEKYKLLLKPHGHGDIHTLLHTSGTAKRLSDSGVRYLLFIQDTNGQVFNAALAAIGVSEQRGYDFNSIAVNRIPGEAVGGIARLVRDGAPDLTINVEYNLLDPLLRATVSPEGDVPNENGFSQFPGNINLLVIRLAPYLKVLESSGGIVAEFVNPKFADSTRTSFKKPSRLETLMQDLPKSFASGEKVGVTIFDRVWCFSACKNNLPDAAQKVAQNGPPESSSSAENDFYEAGRIKLRAAGMTIEETPRQMLLGIPFTTGPRVILRPSFALTLSDVRERIRGGRISGDATLILDGDVHLENVTVPEGCSLIVQAEEENPISLIDFTATPGLHFFLQPLANDELASNEIPEYLRIRGYRIIQKATAV